MQEHTVAHGYTMRDLDRLAHTAVNVAFARGMDYTDRYDAAWHAIAETLSTAEQAPTRRDLTLAGATAVNRHAQDHHRQWGMARRWGAGEGSVPAFGRYWELERRVAPSPEDGVVDRAALRQIWPRLSPTHQHVLMAMAVHADQVAAAEAVGKTTVCFRSHLKNARREFFELWHEGETPSRVWGRSDRRGRRSAMQTLVNRRQHRARRAARAAVVGGEAA